MPGEKLFSFKYIADDMVNGVISENGIFVKSRRF